MRKIEFSKYNGQGNDFIVIDSVTRSIVLSQIHIKSLCDRHFGIGADGLILVKTSEKADFFMDFYNRDGSKAEMCGNGIRCLAGFIFKKGLSRQHNLSIDTPAGKRIVDMSVNGNILGSIRADMGRPVFSPKEIPVEMERDEAFNYKITIDNRVFNINCLSMGNPHCVIFLGEDENLDTIPIGIWGPLIEKNRIFPHKTNVEFVKPSDANRIEMRVWERGVGETLACGTGACAAGVYALKLGKVKGSQVNVKIPGGNLNVHWLSPSGSVFLEGTIEHVFDGVYYLG